MQSPQPREGNLDAFRSRIRLRHLHCFVAVAQTQHLGRAGERLGLTQPAVSKTLTELEELVGTRLLVRQRAGTDLTAAGMRFLRHALRVLEDEQAPVCTFDGKRVINLASNNYLGLTTHPKLREAALEATAVADPHITVAADVERLLASPLLPPQMSVSGHVYDVETGRVTTIVDARHPQPAGNN